jgi:murein DD-endopeptidase MepM/ murein hydrolase activator NlpD
MSDHIHIIVTGAKETARNIFLSRKKLKVGLALTVLFLGISAVGAIFSTRLLVENSNLNAQVAAMNVRLIETSQERRSYANRIDDLLSVNDDLLSVNTNLLTTKTSQPAPFDAEKEALVNQTLAEFNERNELIENIMKSIGVKVKQHKPTANSGGPYLPSSEVRQEDLLLRTDKNLDLLRRTPLGRPLPGAISSPFGYRQDPFNGEKAFHSGVDMEADRGDKIVATADGTVIFVGYNGEYGRFVEVNHGNGFTTSFAHLLDYKVKKGDKVKRGQVVGLVGNSGRSTGAHLHYELCRDGQPINPATFMKTAEFSRIVATKEITAIVPKKGLANTSPAKKSLSAKTIAKKSAVTVKIKKTRKKG